jgi:hypothetical protein
MISTTLSRIHLRWRGKEAGRLASERAAYLFGTIWIICSLAMIGLAIIELTSS